MLALPFIYSTDCDRCRLDASPRLQRFGGVPALTTLDDCLARLSQEHGWNDATRGAYRAQRRKDES
jgi:hypothetical protein